MNTLLFLLVLVGVLSIGVALFYPRKKLCPIHNIPMEEEYMYSSEPMMPMADALNNSPSVYLYCPKCRQIEAGTK